VWIRDRLRFLHRPRILRRDGSDQSSTETVVSHPPVEDEALPDESGTGAILGGVEPENTRSLTQLRRFLSRGAGQRDDGYLFGAIEVTPANMALATDADWEHAVEGFTAAINGLDFPIQIYSTVRPVDPETIAAGYRDRLKAGSEMPDAFERLVATYAERLPQEFAQRGTGLRQYYVIVPVSPLDVQRDLLSVDQTSLVDRLCDLSHLGGFVRTLQAFRHDESIEEQ